VHRFVCVKYEFIVTCDLRLVPAIGRWFLTTEARFDPCGVGVNLSYRRCDWDRVSSEYFRFTVSGSFYLCSLLVFLLS